QVERRLARGRPIPQWFNEGIADHVAWRVTAAAFPEYAARRSFLTATRLASAAQAGALPAITPLTNQTLWVAAGGDNSSLIYASATLLVADISDASGMLGLNQT